MSYYLKVLLIFAFVSIISGLDHRHHQVQHSKHFHRVSRNKHLQTRDNNQTSGHSNENLSFFYNTSNNFGGILNNNSDVGTLFDINENVTVLYNGKSHTIVVFNYKQQIGSLLNITLNPSTWQSYLTNLSSLQDLYRNVSLSGIHFNSTYVPNEISSLLLQSIRSLSPNATSVEAFLQIARNLSNVISHFGNIQSNFSGDLNSLLRQFQTLIPFFDQIFNNSSNNSHLSFGGLFNLTNGLNTFIALLEQFGRNLNISQFSDPSNFFPIIANLGHNSSGLDVLFQIIANFTQNNPSISNIIQGFLHLINNSSGFANLSSEFQTGLQNLQNVISGYQNSGAFSNFLNSLRNGSLRINNTDIFPVISALISNNSTNFIDNIVQALVRFPSLGFPGLNVTIPTLFEQIYSNLANNHSLESFQHLFSNFNTSSSELSAFIDQIRNGSANLSSGSFGNIFQQLPFAGNINQALALATQGASTLAHIFSPETYLNAFRRVIDIISGSNGNGTNLINQLLGIPLFNGSGDLSFTGSGQIEGGGGVNNLFNLAENFIPFARNQDHHEKSAKHGHERHGKGVHTKQHRFQETKKHQASSNL